MHEIPDLGGAKESNGVRRMVRYDQLTSHLFGPLRGKWCLLPFQLATLVGIAITYTVVGGQDLRAFVLHVNPSLELAHWPFYVAFGGLQLVLSLVPSFAGECWCVWGRGAVFLPCVCVRCRPSPARTHAPPPQHVLTCGWVGGWVGVELCVLSPSPRVVTVTNTRTRTPPPPTHTHTPHTNHTPQTQS